MQITVVGMKDLGGNVCSLAGFDGSGKVGVRRRDRRDSVLKLVAKLNLTLWRWRLVRAHHLGGGAIYGGPDAGISGRGKHADRRAHPGASGVAAGDVRRHFFCCAVSCARKLRGTRSARGWLPSGRWHWPRIAGGVVMVELAAS